MAQVSALAAVGLLGLAATAYVALRTSRGQRLDRAAMDAVSSPVLALNRLDQGFGWVTVGSVALALLACMTFAELRGRRDLALGALVVVSGANLSTQFLKYVLFPRFDLSPGPNSLPSGHTTVALSLALAAVIVAPSNWRATVAIGGTAISTLVGVGLVLARYHRPSDVIAGTCVCLGWGAAALLTTARVRRLPSVPRGGVSVHLGALVGAAIVGVLLVSWGVRPEPGLRDLGLGVISLGSIGLACAVSVAAVANMADRHLG